MPLICFASPKGGVGKTTLSANVADMLRRQGRTALALDLDPQNSLRLHFGVPVGDLSGFNAQLLRRPDWRSCLRQAASGTLLLPHGAMELRDALEYGVALERDPGLLATPVREMLADPRVVVVADMPPGPSQALAILMPMANLVVTVLQSEAISAAMLAEIEAGRFLGNGTMAALFAGRLQFVLNGVDMASRLSRTAAEAVARHLGSRLLGAVSRDDAFAEALTGQRLVADAAPGSRAAEDIRQLAQAITALLPANATMPPPAPPRAAMPWTAPEWGTH
ncbi:cellulose synthase operon protein YhjQ [Pseudoroseomonas wenyumeiae]|uniref:Cellulose synthase operon protein YhjQ n=1 Tax=Teichococcus wenyumeiae TaxID=2478470 RepID=A0A3A9J5Y5_9PROT|nr:cellulose synthase operon protein YhjQ/BcsQ [Pseudoroseomonas wenyumeiae]RKK01081.1 cellulose synthase operon protein YhjQ [Pseudoroseomonas wenyumeiae]RMI25264.1 cellulose synthase operon protein YhjQ [Pseudoroseomonas wenyumeiae]